MKVYFISGLAADSRVFKYIRLPEHCEPVFLEWISPFKDESLTAYAMRLAKSIDTGKRFGIIGLSMGGMIATEIARKLHPAFVILISSIADASQLPFYFKIIGRLQLHRLVPVATIKSAAVMKRVFTRETNGDKAMLRSIIRDSDNHFIHWAMNAILKWKTTGAAFSYTHIHGARDGVLPMRFTQPTHIIKSGGHLLVMTNAREINAILSEVLVRS